MEGFECVLCPTRRGRRQIYASRGRGNESQLKVEVCSKAGGIIFAPKTTRKFTGAPFLGLSSILVHTVSNSKYANATVLVNLCQWEPCIMIHAEKVGKHLLLSDCRTLQRRICRLIVASISNKLVSQFQYRFCLPDQLLYCFYPSKRATRSKLLIY